MRQGKLAQEIITNTKNMWNDLWKCANAKMLGVRMQAIISYFSYQETKYFQLNIHMNRKKVKSPCKYWSWIVK